MAESERGKSEVLLNCISQGTDVALPKQIQAALSISTLGLSILLNCIVFLSLMEMENLQCLIHYSGNVHALLHGRIILQCLLV